MPSGNGEAGLASEKGEKVNIMRRWDDLGASLAELPSRRLFTCWVRGRAIPHHQCKGSIILRRGGGYCYLLGDPETLHAGGAIPEPILSLSGRLTTWVQFLGHRRRETSPLAVRIALFVPPHASSSVSSQKPHHHITTTIVVATRHRLSPPDRAGSPRQAHRDSIELGRR